MLFEALKEFGTPASQAVLVGDSATDLQAAARAGVHTRILVCTGHGREVLQGWRLDPEALVTPVLLRSLPRRCKEEHADLLPGAQWVYAHPCAIFLGNLCPRGQTASHIPPLAVALWTHTGIEG
ncbi:hypothetical protein CYMTET_15341 [Cymbomonas tetramitiformis]|uniref:Phosphoglycolate phosphatase n=2 Tax=Cymbomonas tetramitiformis TaxID=36881 RepID=A0AAE0GEF6_9CHLO|nr:hypothetical protein CYMTET_15341 [Cymbomonas tetramitiformis]